MKNLSMVCDHFTKGSEYSDDDPLAKCSYCGMVYACHPSKNGNSTMKTQIKKSKLDVTPSKVIFNKEETMGDSSSSSNSYKIFSIESAQKLMVEMILIDKLSFKFLESEGFKRFVEGTFMLAEPNFVLPSRKTIAKYILEIYTSMKDKLKDIFVDQEYRVSLTIDNWTSIQNMNYLVLTAHFIDRDWKLHRKILNFTQIENHRGETIGKEVEKCLKQWGIERVMTLTVDNGSSNDIVIAYLKKSFKHGLVLDGDFLHVRCCVHILDLIVYDALKDVNDSIERIRNAVRFVRSSPARLAKFKKCTEEEKISSNSTLCLDVQTRWISTYLMLDAALKFEKAFERLEDHDIVYMNDKSKPTTKDWEIARILTKFLVVFYEITVRLSGSPYVTYNIVFHEISTIQNCIRKYSSVTSPDDFLLHEMAIKMQQKFDKYWGQSEKTNLFLYVAFILDPRYKMKFLMYCLNQLFNADVAKEVGNKVEGVLRKLFNEYCLSLPIANTGSSSHMSKNRPSMSQSLCQSQTDTSSLFSITTNSRAFSFEFKGMEDDDTQNVDVEVDIYLLEPRVKYEENFDILDWWKMNSSRYKVLSRIARDLLAIPVSTVACESALNTCGRVIDPFHTSLAPTTVEVFVCAQNWLRSEEVRIDLEQYLENIVCSEEGLMENEEATTTTKKDNKEMEKDVNDK